MQVVITNSVFTVSYLHIFGNYIVGKPNTDCLLVIIVFLDSNVTYVVKFKNNNCYHNHDHCYF